MGGVLAVLKGYGIGIIIPAVLILFINFNLYREQFEPYIEYVSKNRSLKNWLLITICFVPFSAFIGVGLNYFLWARNQWQPHWGQPLWRTFFVLLGYVFGATILGLIAYGLCPYKGQSSGAGEIGNFVPVYYAYWGILIGALLVASLSSYLIFRARG